MLMNNMKIFFFFLMLMSNTMMLFSSFWFNMWICLEVNLISFILLMINYKNYLSLESALIYFLIQTIASIMFIYSIIMTLNYNNLYMIMMISMMIKLSMAPFHFWLPMMIESINWMTVYLLLTWQKLGPLILLNLFNNNFFLMIFIFYSMIIGSIMGLNFSSMKKILTYSSINQMSWIVLSLILLNNFFKIYFIMYMYMMLLIIYSLNFFKIYFINNIYMMKMKFINMFIFFNFLSLGGLPPFLGFFPKMLIIFKMNNSILIFILIMFTLITLFYYIRIILSMMLLNSTKINFLKMKKNMNKFKFLMILSFFNNFFLMIFFFFY